MGRLLGKCKNEREFLSTMENEVNRMVTGDFDREETVRLHVGAYRNSYEALMEAAKKDPRAERIIPRMERGWLEGPGGERRTFMQAPKEYEETSRDQIITRGSGIPTYAPPETWELYGQPGQSSLTPGYDFLNPPFDHEDAGEYCASADAKPAFRALLARWLAHEWSVNRIDSAYDALRRAFEPLRDWIIHCYGTAGRRELGEEYEETARSYLQAVVDAALEDFDFFYKKRFEDLISDNPRRPADEIPDRRLGYLTSDFEIALALFLERRMDSALRGFLDLPRNNPRRVRGPFRADGHPSEIMLLEDAREVLGVGSTQVRERIRRGDLTAWKAREFREKVGLRVHDPIVLRNPAGEANAVKSQIYWLIDADSVYDLKKRQRDEGAYRRGRPRMAKPSS